MLRTTENRLDVAYHAQQDVWEETLVAARIRAGEADKARRALESRPSPRAARWLERARSC